MANIKYRPEIDGLRAIAVLAVVIYHAKFILNGKELLPGGYLGVDVFFVISGYLITLILLKQIANKTFSFKSFYKRRLRRIAPALLGTMLAVLPFAWYSMFPNAAYEYCASILSSLGMGSNFLFWREDSYWAAVSDLKPFLHTWSLSIEEQFYIFFPILLIFINKKKILKNNLAKFLVFTFIFSLAFSQYASIHHVKTNFFLLPSRAWELLAGSLLAYLEINFGRNISSQLKSNVLVGIGLTLVVLPFFLFKKETPHPSILTLIPILGSTLVVWYGSSIGYMTKIISHKVLVYIGLISYSLYLWHFPIFALYKINGFEVSNLIMFVLICGSFFISILSYKWIEKPFRNPKIISDKAFYKSIVASFLIIFCTAAFGYFNKGNWLRFNKKQSILLGASQLRGKTRGSYTDYVVKKFNSERDLKFKKTNKRKILLLGDSYAQDFYNILYEGKFLKDLDIVTHYIDGRCRNVLYREDNNYNLAKTIQQKCKHIIRVGDTRLDGIMSDADLIIMASAWKKYSTNKMPELSDYIETKYGKKVVFVGRKKFGKLGFQEVLKLKNNDYNNILKEVEAEHTRNIQLARRLMFEREYLDLHNIICKSDTVCPITSDLGDLISYDGRHLTKKGAIYTSNLLKENVQFLNMWNRLAR